MFKHLKIVQFINLLKWFWGNLDGMLITLIVFIIVDCFSTILLSISRPNYSKLKIPQWIAKRALILLLIGTTNIIDIYLTDSNSFRTATLWFYIAYEGIIILKNTSALGLPVPKFLMEFLKNLQYYIDNNKTE